MSNEKTDTTSQPGEVRSSEWLGREPSYGWMHIYAQPFNHVEAYVCGTREALEQLKVAIDAALTGKPSEFVTFTGDGEGYSVYVACATEEQIQAMQLPYTDDCAGTDSRTFGPWTLVHESP